MSKRMTAQARTHVERQGQVEDRSLGRAIVHPHQSPALALISAAVRMQNRYASAPQFNNFTAHRLMKQGYSCSATVVQQHDAYLGTRPRRGLLAQELQDAVNLIRWTCNGIHFPHLVDFQASYYICCVQQHLRARLNWEQNCLNRRAASRPTCYKSDLNLAQDFRIPKS